MQTFLFYLRISLGIIGGWFVIILWFLLLNVGKSPLNEMLIGIGIVPLMTHSNIDGMLDVQHWLFMIQSVFVFSSGGLIAALVAKDRELIAASILGVLAVLTCIIWDSNINCKIFYSIDLFIWFFGFSLIMLSGFIIKRKRLIDYIFHRLTRGPSPSSRFPTKVQQEAQNTGTARRPPVGTSSKYKTR
jgi:hypothetical protein